MRRRFLLAGLRDRVIPSVVFHAGGAGENHHSNNEAVVLVGFRFLQERTCPRNTRSSSRQAQWNARADANWRESAWWRACFLRNRSNPRDRSPGKVSGGSRCRRS